MQSPAASSSGRKRESARAATRRLRHARCRGRRGTQGRTHNARPRSTASPLCSLDSTFVCRTTRSRRTTVMPAGQSEGELPRAEPVARGCSNGRCQAAGAGAEAVSASDRRVQVNNLRMRVQASAPRRAGEPPLPLRQPVARPEPDLQSSRASCSSESGRKLKCNGNETRHSAASDVAQRRTLPHPSISGGGGHGPRTFASASAHAWVWTGSRAPAGSGAPMVCSRGPGIGADCGLLGLHPRKQDLAMPATAAVRGRQCARASLSHDCIQVAELPARKCMTSNKL